MVKLPLTVILTLLFLVTCIHGQIPQSILDQKLVIACIKNDVEAVKELLAKGASANVRGLFGQPAILIAAQTHRGFYSEEKTLVIIDLLLKHGADINAKNAFGTTPLMASQVYASSVESLNKEQQKVDAFFIARGADKNVKDIFGGELIDYPYFSEEEYPSRSAKGKPLDVNVVVWRLVIEGQTSLPGEPEKYGSDGEGINLVMAAAYYGGSLYRVNPSKPIYFDADKNGNTVPIYAAIGDCPDCLSGLDNKAFVNRQNKWGETALIMAAQFDHGYVIIKLLAAGADTALKDEKGKSALFYAAEYDHSMSTLNLLAGGANPQEFNKDGLTPLMLAAKLGNKQAVTAYVMAKSLAVKARRTANKSRRESDIILAKTLEKIDLNARNSRGETALGLARRYGHREIINLLTAPNTKKRPSKK